MMLCRESGVLSRSALSLAADGAGAGVVAGGIDRVLAVGVITGTDATIKSAGRKHVGLDLVENVRSLDTMVRIETANDDVHIDRAGDLRMQTGLEDNMDDAYMLDVCRDSTLLVVKA